MIQDFQKYVKRDLKEIREEQMMYREELEKIKEENKLLHTENEANKKRLLQLEQKVEEMDRDKRRNNIIVQGMPIAIHEEQAIKHEMETLMKNKLEVDIKIKGARELGENTCLLELNNNTDKQLVMANKRKLKNVREARIYINNDVSKEDREVQSKIRTVAKEEGSKGKTVKIRFGKLNIDDEEWYGIKTQNRW